MQIRGSAETPETVAKEEGEGYLKLTFSDGTVVYVNLTEGDLDVDGILTDAIAVTVKNGAFMMADGSYIDIDGENIISADKRISAYVSESKLSFFANEDTNVSVDGHYSDTYRDENGNYHTGYIRDGFSWSKTDNGVLLKMVKGAYTLKMK